MRVKNKRGKKWLETNHSLLERLLVLQERIGELREINKVAVWFYSHTKADSTPIITN